MSKLSDSQLVVLSAACQRPDRCVLPLPPNLKGGAASKVVNSLLAKGLVKEVRAKRDEPVWRTDDDRGRIVLRATRAAFEALGIDPTEAGSEDEAERASDEQNAETADQSARRPKGKKRACEPSLERSKSTDATPRGATIDEIVKAFGWPPHTVRGAIAGALKKMLGSNVRSDKDEQRGRVNRI